MDLSVERDSSALGSLFQLIINDMKNTSPLWDDFVAKASKLHACLRAAIQAIAAYLDAFQKIADAATNSKGASREIGTALTRVCLRHKAVETRLKTFTSAIMDCLVQPLQEKIEDWKRSVTAIDKDHAKEYKRCRTELKKRSSDTLRLQKKARKGQNDNIQSLMDSHMQDVTLRRAELEEVEKKSLRSVMIEERMRYCTFVHLLQPVVKEECEVMFELGHLQEAMHTIAVVTKDPNILPQASEELIHDTKASMNLYPESPGTGSGSQGVYSNSLGSRKSSVCSISSINSSGSSNSPSHPQYQRSLSQTPNASCQSNAAVATWAPHSQDTSTTLPTQNADRPHTISTTYEKGHQRPPLTVYTFQNPETIPEGNGAAVNNCANSGVGNFGQSTPSTQKSIAAALARPPLPVRCSSLERPLAGNTNNRNNGNLMQRQCPSPIPAHITKELSATHHAQHHQQQVQQQQVLQQLQQLQQPLQSPPTYVNMSELANMAALKAANNQTQAQLQSHSHAQTQVQTQVQHSQAELHQQNSVESISSQLSNHDAAPPVAVLAQSHSVTPTGTRSLSISSSTASTSSPSLHSHPSIDSNVTVASTPHVGHSTSQSSGSSTPQNHYSPLLTNSPTSTAAGTPSGGSIASGMTSSIGGGSTSGFIYNVSSPTPPQSDGLVAGDALKITESLANNYSATFETRDVPDSNATNISQNISVNTIDTDSVTVVEHDERTRASVLQKASMFEKQAAAASSVAAGRTANVNTAAVHAAEKSCQQQQQREPEQEVDKNFEDSIQELNNLIGELDSFQREIDAEKQQKQVISNNKRTDSFAPLSAANRGQKSHATTMPDEDDVEVLTISIAQQLDSADHTSVHSTRYCASNQTNSSGCGTDISDTTSEELLADTHSLGGGTIMASQKLNCNYNSDSELSRCYVSESSSVTGVVGGVSGDGYENPTFAHLAGAKPCVRSFNTDLDDDTHLQQQHLPQMVCSADNIGMDVSCSGVIMIYDHQIPMTPDLDYVKQNSEIVILRTKDPQQQQAQKEMRELQQLPTNLSGSPDSPDATALLSLPTATATVAPAKQRLSSFRATSEQHLQLLGSNLRPQGAISGSSTRIARRSSVNTAKPPPPVRRSSSVTPSPNTPTASGSFRTSSPGIYAQPKIMNNMSSFRSVSPAGSNTYLQHNAQAHAPVPAQPKVNPNLIAQLNARLSNKQQQHSNSENIYAAAPILSQELIYARSSPQQQAMHLQQQQQQYFDDYSTSNTPNIEKAGSIRAKTKAEFLENLNAKLAKQGMSGKAFAVRNLINSKALPDPRMCHESLMDQIKRGATLKRNKKINDRSAPKIH